MGNIIHLENELLQIVGATKIVSATSSQAVVETSEKTIVVSGNDIEVKKLNLDDGEVVLSGKFENIKFVHPGNKKQPFLKRLFK